MGKYKRKRANPGHPRFNDKPINRFGPQSFSMKSRSIIILDRDNAPILVNGQKISRQSIQANNNIKIINSVLDKEFTR